MPAFALARRLRAGETVYGAWCMLGSPVVAETIAREGFATVVLDAQHGLWDTNSLISGSRCPQPCRIGTGGAGTT